MSLPLVSVIMIVRNGMPYVADAARSVLEQTYPNLEFIVQDCCSTDGTLEALHGLKANARIPIDIASEHDGGIADGYNRAVRRTRGDYFAVMEADNLFLPQHVEVGMKHLLGDQQLAVVSTSQQFIDGDGAVTSEWASPPLDFFGTLLQERIFPSGSTIKNKRLLGDDVFYWVDPIARHCCDYEYWLRLSLKGYKTEASPHFTYATRFSAASGTCDVARYEEFCREKIHTVDVVATRLGDTPLLRPTIALARAGIFMWAAESVWDLGGTYVQALDFAARAWRNYPAYPRVGSFLYRLHGETGRDPFQDFSTGLANLPVLYRRR